MTVTLTYALASIGSLGLWAVAGLLVNRLIVDRPGRGRR